MIFLKKKSLDAGLDRVRPNRSLKRTVIIDPGGLGGLCHYTYNLCRALVDLGADVHLVTSIPYELDKFPLNFEVHAFPLRRPWGLIASLNTIRRLRPDIIHLQGTNLHPVFELAYLRTSRLVGKAPVVYTSHNLLPHKDVGWQTPFIGPKLRCADAVIVHAEATRDEAISRFGVSPSRLNVIPHGNYRFFRNLSGRRKQLPWTKSPGVKDVLFFGTIGPHKGLVYLIEAIGRLREAGIPVRLMVAGKPIEDWHPYQDALKRWDLADNTLLSLGYIPMENVPSYFEFADAVCLPYLEGGSESGVVYLADAFNLPVIATNRGI